MNQRSMRFSSRTSQATSARPQLTFSSMEFCGRQPSGGLSQPFEVVSTFLGAHEFPDDRSREAYIAEILDEMIPEVARRAMAEFNDVYCDDGYYSVTGHLACVPSLLSKMLLKCNRISPRQIIFSKIC
ncbi:hypothetical protein ACFSQT_14285 [Mesorhizobium calcicola]|uniref:Uncharacterized protein n=1 Tax=Mesorhizobium calcicola TaxID=1300310 RepID=A0ABW4WCJ0_9HYPH